MKINFMNIIVLKSIYLKMKIKQKILLALVFVSTFLVIMITIVSLTITRNILSSNSVELTNNYVKQISISMGERIDSFEDAAFLMSKQSTILRLFDKININDNSGQVQQIVKNMKESIFLSPLIYKYTKYSFIESKYGNRYEYKKSKKNEIIKKNIEKILELGKKNVNRLHPLNWIKIDDDIFFILLNVDDKTFEIKGITYFCMDESFLNFTNTQYNTQRFIILNSSKDIMFSEHYDVNEDSIKSLLSSNPASYNVKNKSINYDGHKILISEILNQMNEWRIICLTDAEELFRRDKLLIVSIVLIAGIAFILSIILAINISKGIIINIKEIEKRMTQVEEGNFSVRIKPSSYDEVGMLGMRFNYMINQIEALIQSVAKERFAKQDAEFKVLQAQINPHFLYNSLGSVKWLSNRYGQDEIERMIDSIIALLKGSIKISNSFQTVADELDYVKSYIQLQKFRYGDAFSVEYDIMAQTYEAVIPGFMLQPIVENSIYHGIDMLEEDGIIVIRSFVLESMLYLQIIDNGIGINEDRLEEIINQPEEPVKYKSFNSIGIKIVNDRLKAYYGDMCNFTIRNNKSERGVTVEISLPFTTEFQE